MSLNFSLSVCGHSPIRSFTKRCCNYVAAAATVVVASNIQPLTLDDTDQQQGRGGSGTFDGFSLGRHVVISPGQPFQEMGILRIAGEPAGCWLGVQSTVVRASRRCLLLLTAQQIPTASNQQDSRLDSRYSAQKPAHTKIFPSHLYRCVGKATRLGTTKVPSARHETVWRSGFINPFSTSAKNEMNGELHGPAAFVLGSSTGYQMNRMLAMPCCVSGCFGGKNKFYLRRKKEISHFLKASIRELVPIHPPIRWIPGAVQQGLK